MKKWFVNNYKLIKLNGILLLTFIFFLILQLCNSSYAVTKTDLDANNETVSEWAYRVLDHYNMVENNAFYIVLKRTTSSLTNYYLYCIPALVNNYTLLTSNLNSYGYINLHPYVTSIVDVNKSDFIFGNDNYYNYYILDYNYSTNSYTSSMLYSNGASGSFVFYPTSSGSLVSGSGGISFSFTYNANNDIIYTNAKNFVEDGYYKPAVLKTLNRELKVFKFEDFIEFGTDNYFGDYIKFKEGLEDTDCSNIFLQGSCLNGTTTSSSQSITVNISGNYSDSKFYLYNSPSITVYFRNSSNSVLYTYTKDLINDSMGNTTGNDFVDVDFDFSTATVGEFNGVWYYDHCDFYYKFNNIGNFPTYATDIGDICYLPNLSYDLVFDNGQKFSTGTYFFDFDDTYSHTLYGLPAYLNKYQNQDENSEEFMQNYGVYRFFSSFVGNLAESINSGYNFKIIVNLKIDKCQVVSHGTSVNVDTIETPYSKSVIVDFNVASKNATNVVVTITDTNGDNMGTVTVDGTGTIVSNTLTGGYSVGSDNSSVYDSNGNLVYTFVDTGNGWEQRDNTDTVVKNYTPVTIGERIKHTNDTANSGTIISDLSSGIGNIFTTLSETLTGLLGNVGSIGEIFSKAFNWLPSPIPQLVISAFVCCIVFAIIRFIRG